MAGAGGAPRGPSRPADRRAGGAAVRAPDLSGWPRSHAEAAARVSAARPELAQLTPLGRGDFCHALTATDGRVVRVARHAEAGAALRREACVLAAAADRLPLPVPRPTVIVDEPGLVVAEHAMVPGVPLTGPRWRRLPAAARDRVAGELAGFLRALHAAPTPCALPTLDAGERAHALHGRLSELPPVPGLVAMMSRLGRVDDVAHAAVIHRDVAPGHVLYDPAARRLTGIIDFGDVALGDPARDLVYVDEDFGPDLLEAVLAHYAPPAEADALRRRMRRWQLLELLDWTLAMGAAAGVAALPGAVARLAAVE